MAQQIRRAVNRFLTQEQTIHHVAGMHRSIKQMCEAHGVCFDDPPPQADGQTLPDFMFARCAAKPSPPCKV